MFHRSMKQRTYQETMNNAFKEIYERFLTCVFDLRSASHITGGRLNAVFPLACSLTLSSVFAR